MSKRKSDEIITYWWGSSVAVIAGKPLPIGVLLIESRRERGKRSGMKTMIG